MSKTYGYCRVSTATQVDQGDSLDAQRRLIELICELEDFNLAKIFVEEGVSAGKSLSKRPEGKSLLDIVQDSDVIVTVKLDRLFRDIEDAVTTLKGLKKRGVKLHIKDLGGDVTADGVSSLLFNLMSSISDFERGRIGERIRDVKAHHRAQGRFLGGSPPFAHDVVMTYDADKGNEIAVLQRNEDLISFVTDLRQREYSLRMIVWELRRERDIWTTPTVLSKFFRSPLVTGEAPSTLQMEA